MQELLCIFIVDKSIDIRNREMGVYQELRNSGSSRASKVCVQEMLCIFILGRGNT